MIRKMSDDILTSTQRTSVLGSTEELNEVTALKRPSRKKKRNLQTDFPKWLKKQEKINHINHIASYVFNLDEISCVTMSEDYYITDISTLKLSRAVFRNPMLLWETINPWLQLIPPVHLHVLESSNLPPSFYRTNLALRSISMLLIGSLQSTTPRVIELNRKRVGDVFELIVEGTSNRASSEVLVHEILRERRWKETDVLFSPDLIRPTYDRVFVEKQQGTAGEVRMSPATGDAILQAIAYWSVAHTLR